MELAGPRAPGFVFEVAPPGPVVAVAAPLLTSLLLPVCAGSDGPVGLPGKAFVGLRFAEPWAGWVAVPVCGPAPCCLPAPSRVVLVSNLVAVPGGGGVVVVDVDVALTGKTCLVELLALVSTSAFGGMDACPLLIASALVRSVVGSCGPDPV